MKKTILRELYECNKCNGGVIQVRRVMTRTSIKIDIEKCTTCKHPWGLKQIADRKPKHIKTVEDIHYESK